MNLSSIFGRKGVRLYQTAFFGYIPEFTEKSDELNSNIITPKFVDLCHSYNDGFINKETFHKGLGIIYSHCTDELWECFYRYLTSAYPSKSKKPVFVDNAQSNYIQPVYNDHYALCEIRSNKSRITPFTDVEWQVVSKINQHINKSISGYEMIDLSLLGYIDDTTFVVHDILVENSISTRMKMKDMFSHFIETFDVVETHQITDNKENVLRLLVEQKYEAYLSYEMTSNRTFHWKLNKLKGTS